MKKLCSLTLSVLACFAFASSALADVAAPIDPLLETPAWALLLAGGIAAVALSLLIHLVLKARRDR